MCGKPARTVYEGDPASEEPRRNALLHKRNIKRLFLGIAAGFFAVLALLCVRYGGTAKRILSSGYIVETHKDHFNFFGFPGSGGDMQGFCKVIPPNNSLKAAYFYLEMTQFVSEINDATIKFQGDAFLENRPETPQAIAKVRQPRKIGGTSKSNSNNRNYGIISPQGKRRNEAMMTKQELHDEFWLLTKSVLQDSKIDVDEARVIKRWLEEHRDGNSFDFIITKLAGFLGDGYVDRFESQRSLMPLDAS